MRESQDNKQDCPRDPDSRAGASAPARTATRVLIAHPDEARAGALAAMLADRDLRCHIALSVDEALAQLDGSCDVAVVADALADEGACCIANAVRFEDLPARVILLSRTSTLDLALRAMRAGACDLLPDPPAEAELIASVVAAADRARSIRAAREELTRLRELSQRLDSAHSQLANHLDALCDDLSRTCASLADQVEDGADAADLESRLSGLLDVEAVLRIVLEHILARVGPTNAAVFLPGESGDFNLGAYVNYDCEKESADILLDHLADVLAPAFRDEEAIVALTSAEEQEEWLGDEAAWLADYDNLLAIPCRRAGECFAVVALFRESSAPFDHDAITAVEAARDAFTAQMQRIVRVHHRLAPRDDDPAGWDGASDDEGGLAA